MVCQARKRSRNGILSHVKVSINSISPCRVEKLLAPPRKSSLQLGQRITLFAKVHVPSIGYDDKAAINTPDELFDDLARTLGDSKSGLFKAEVQYRHSLLPKETEIRTGTTCTIQRTNRSSGWGDLNSGVSRNGLDLEIEKAHFIARNYAPDLAIKIMRKKFGNVWLEDNHSTSLHLLRTELEFQSNVLAESKNAASKTHEAKSSDANTLGKRATLHLYDSQAFIPNTKPRSQSSTQDEARKIWRHMRRNSRNKNVFVTCSEPNSRNASEVLRRGSQESVIEALAEGDVRLRELRMQALRNKRSVGAETLREFGEIKANSAARLQKLSCF